MQHFSGFVTNRVVSFHRHALFIMTYTTRRVFAKCICGFMAEVSLHPVYAVQIVNVQSLQCVEPISTAAPINVGLSFGVQSYSIFIISNGDALPMVSCTGL
jgi:hypothetical protein